MEYAIVVLLVFALYLLARWQYVKRPLFYLLGVGGIALAFFGGFFSGVSAIAVNIFHTLGALISLAGFVGACYGAQLPINIPGDNQKQPPTSV